MTSEPVQMRDAVQSEARAPREWVRPVVHHMTAGDAENAPGDNRADGTGTFS